LSSPGYCWYNNDQTTYGETYGSLYNWYVVETGKLCPIGWHVPTDAEWTTLYDFLGGFNIAGGKLKETGTMHWNSPNIGATNESGFTALPGGNRSTIGFNNVGSMGFWWTATEYSPSYAWVRFMDYNMIEGHWDSEAYKQRGFSVRCIKD
jgi:uncharacterized protein (TIGR02145 family)